MIVTAESQVEATRDVAARRRGARRARRPQHRRRDRPRRRAARARAIPTRCSRSCPPISTSPTRRRSRACSSIGARRRRARRRDRDDRHHADARRDRLWLPRGRGRAAPGAVTPVQRFVEKPDRATAERYVASGRYLWNAGIFCATARRLLAELDAHLPATGARGARDRARAATRAALYPTLPSISIDHAVMEKAERRRHGARRASAGTTSARGPRCPRCAASTPTATRSSATALVIDGTRQRRDHRRRHADRDGRRVAISSS